MTRLVLGQLRHRSTRAFSLGLGILVAAVSFTLLTAAVHTGDLQIRGTIAQEFKAAYDILVRPPDSYTELERREGLVAPNFASGIFGGITRKQWQEILTIPGVEVAAPIANLGYIAPFGGIRFKLDRFLNRDPIQIYRLRLTWSADRGLSRYRGQDSFVYYTRVNPITNPRYGFLYEVLPNGERLEVCFGFNRSNPPVPNSPFTYSTREGWVIQCFSERSPNAARGNVFPFSPGSVGSGTDVLYPFLIAGVDPVQEERLLGLNGSVVSGRPLRPSDRVRRIDGRYVIPILASSTAFVDQSLEVEVARLEIPDDVDVPRTLASLRAFRFVTNLDGRVVGQLHVSSQWLYRRKLDQLEREAGGLQNYWQVSPLEYRATPAGHLIPSSVTNPQSVYELPCCGPTAGPGNQDVQFRVLDNHKGQPNVRHRFDIVGRFDPARVLGFEDPSRVPLAAYASPALRPADQHSRRVLQGQPLLPSMNLGGYIQQPPFLLTTLRGLRFFTNPSVFDGANPKAPISVIRVRVAGVTGPDELSLARLRSVAQLIRQRTGLAVDIVAGSSPSPLLIELSEGNNGRPPLLLREEWVRKGVAVEIIRALDRKSLLLFLLVLLVTGFFLANGALAAVRSRRIEIGTLSCLGWSQSRIFQAVLMELALVGLIAGLVGTALALGLIAAFSLETSLWRALLVVPVAVALACLAGIAPAARATRIAPLDAVRPPVSDRSSSRSIGGLVGMAWVNLQRVPSRTLVGTSGLFVGVLALTLLLAINLGFKGVLVGSLLGNVISVQVRAVDLVSVVLTLLLSGLSVADVLWLNVRERAAEFASLRATGWDDGWLGLLVALEGVTIGFVASVLGAVTGVALAVAIAGATAQVAVAGGLAVLAATLISLAASVVPARLVSRLPAAAVLAEE